VQATASRNSTEAGAPPGTRCAVGDELILSNPGQRELLEAVLGRGVPLRAMMRGGSMFPCVRDSDIVTVAPVAGQSLRVGDIVAFRLASSDRMAVHRIVAASSAGWVIRGDACAVPDGLVASDRIIGKVVAVTRNGRSVRFGISVGAKCCALLSRRSVFVRLNTVAFALRRVGSALARSVSRGPGL